MAAHTDRITTFECTNGKTFLVTRDEQTAIVDHEGRSFKLQRGKSSIGLRYSSAEASLILDDDLAVFVTEDLLDLRSCRRAGE